MVPVDATTLADLVARDRRDRGGDRTALRAEGPVDYRRFCTTAWKASNHLRHLGVREGTRVGVAAAPAAQSLYAFLGAALLGAPTRFGPPPDADLRVLVAPTERFAAGDAWSDPAPSIRRVGYGTPPDDPAIRHWEGEVWSENPTPPPTAPAPDAPALTDGERTYDQRALLEAARTATRALDLGADETVAVRAPLSEPRAVAAGVVAPLLVGASIVLGESDPPTDAAVASGGDAPEARTLRIDDVAL